MKIQEAQDLLRSLLSSAGFSVGDIHFEEKGDGQYSFNIMPQEGEAMYLIGRNGDVLRSFQSLLKNIFRAQSIIENGENVRIDIDSYRVNQESNVLVMAEKKAQQVLESGRSVLLPPMSSFFRRLVHLHIREKFPELSTFSKGSLNDRCVCITLEEAGSDEGEKGASPSPDLYAEIEF